jgi:hypothetical protein
VLDVLSSRREDDEEYVQDDEEESGLEEEGTLDGVEDMLVAMWVLVSGSVSDSVWVDDSPIGDISIFGRLVALGHGVGHAC